MPTRGKPKSEAVPACAPTPRPADAPPQVQGTLPPSQVRPSPTNPRKTFPEEGLRQLAASFAEHGVLQPVLVRPMGEKAKWTGKAWEGLDHFEVVAGERRLRAARLANLAGIPAVIRWLTDTEVLEIQLIENDQREDVLPSEQAAAYARLVAAGGTVERVVEATGKTASFVRSVLALAKLPAWALAAVDAGTLPRRTAELVARIPGERSREECAAWVLCDQGDGYGPPADCKDFGKWVAKNQSSQAMTYRDTEQLIRENFQVELKQAKFSRKALDLVEGAGSCDACPKRAGNNAEAKEAGTRADVCLDPACFREKTAAHNERAVKLAKESGRAVLAAKESDKLFDKYSPGRLPWNSPYVDLDTRCYESGANGRTYRQLLKSLPADQVVIAVDADGNPHDLVKRDAAKKVLKEEHKIGAKQSSGNDSWHREQKKRAEKASLYKAVAQKASAAVGAKVREAMEDGLNLMPLLKHLAHGVAEHASADACRLVANGRGLEKSDDQRGRVQEIISRPMSSAELLGLVAEIVAAMEAESWCFSYYSGRMDKEEAAWWKAFGVDREKLLKEAQAEKDAKAKPGKKTTPKKPAEKRHGQVVGFFGKKCRACGCTDDDCRQCVEKTGVPCSWVEGEDPPICSRCADEEDAANKAEMEAPEKPSLKKAAEHAAKNGAVAITKGTLADGKPVTVVSHPDAAPKLDKSLASIPGFPPALAAALELSGCRTDTGLCLRVNQEKKGSHEDKVRAVLKTAPGTHAVEVEAGVEAVLAHLYPTRKKPKAKVKS